jgi:putative dimethyl sulfoxide reductase chaperone
MHPAPAEIGADHDLAGFAACLRLGATLMRFPDPPVAAALEQALPHFEGAFCALTGRPGPALPGLDELQFSYTSLFLANPAGVPAVPYLSCRLEPEGQTYGAATLEMRRLMALEGVQVERSLGEPEDHIGLVLDFVALLAERSPGNPGRRATLRLLTEVYLSPFLSGFCADLDQVQPDGFYARSAAFCHALIENHRLTQC